MNCDFSLRHYEECLKKAVDEKYSFLPMAEKLRTKEQKIICLRHDIDHHLSLAMNFAKIEHKLGIRATYFIRMHGRYNTLFHENAQILKKFVDMGHEIALHHDADFARLIGADAEQLTKAAKAMLETVISKNIQGLSTHEPNKSKDVITDDKLAAFGFTYQAYADAFIKDMKYISDSSSRWREGCMCNFIGKQEKLCILTHPLWWYDKSPLENY